MRFDTVKSSVDATEVSQCVFSDTTKLPRLKCFKNPVRETGFRHFYTQVLLIFYTR